MNDATPPTGDPSAGFPEPIPPTDAGPVPAPEAVGPPEAPAPPEAVAPPEALAPPEAAPPLEAVAPPEAPAPEPARPPAWPIDTTIVPPATVAVPSSGGSVRAQNRIAIVATVAVLLVLVAGGAYLLGRGTGDGPAGPGASLAVGGPATASPGASATPAPTAGDPSAGPTLTPPASPDPIAELPSDNNRLGSADAKVVVEYWADYQCPFCAKFAREGIPQLLPQLKDGSIALVHRDFAFIGPESFDAAVAVRCAGREGKYWPMHDAVYAAQAGENQGAFSRDKLVAIGESIGLTGDTVRACLDDRSLLVEVLDDTSAANRTAVESTPTIDVNGTRFLGVPDPAELGAAITAALAGASPKPLPTQAPIPDPWGDASPRGREAGLADAPVTVDLWMDYQATEDTALATDLEDQLRSRAAKGKVRVVLHDLALLGDESVVAGTYLRCIDAQSGPTWLVHEILLASAQGADAGIYTPDNLLRLGAKLGLDIVELDSCLADDAVATAVRDETDAGKALGLDTSPAIVVSAGGKEVARFSGTIDATKVLAAIDKAG